ncbi:CorA metal ion transporter [Spiromyces aspiralis]|uniref:CorA metal ion transporter n=1 Tax=Spiromyces aspiralis TaxID=68401 RepID=A0ACC1HMS7_9FUNG|nr:CorA metal ion transporter [Spiromyces aspiralis]
MGLDWINYAIIDDITDQIAPIMRSVEFEIESIDELVLILSSSEQSDMLLRIGTVRKRTMMLLRLLQGKADVVRSLIKRFESATTAAAMSAAANANIIAAGFHHPPVDSAAGTNRLVHSNNNNNISSDSGNSFITRKRGLNGLEYSRLTDGMRGGPFTTSSGPLPCYQQQQQQQQSHPLERVGDIDMPFYPTTAANPDITTIAAQKGNEIRLYLGDILDHIVTMVQNTNHYEAVISRAHGNYLAKISYELTETSNRTNDVVGKLSALASILVPLNVVTGLWGMNVPVPGQFTNDLTWFFGILTAMMAFALLVIAISKRLGVI